MRAGLTLMRPASSPALALLAAALAWSGPGLAADVTLGNVRISAGGITYQAPTIVVRDTNLSRSDLERILDATAPEPVAERVSRLNAAEMQIPELRSEMPSPGGRQVAVYREVRMRGVAAGKIASVEAAGGSFETTDTDKPAKGTFGPMRVEDMDLGLSLALLNGASGATSNAALQRIYALVTIDDLAISDTNAGVTTRIGRMSGRDLSAKPTQGGWMALLNQIGSTPDLKAASPDARRRSVDAMAELFDSFSFGSMEAANIAFANARDGSSGKVTRVLFTGSSGGREAEIRVEGIEGGSKDGRMRLSSFVMGGLSMRPVIEAMRNSDNLSGGRPDAAALRKLIPASFTYRLEGLEVVAGGGGGQQGAPTPWGGGAPSGPTPVTFSLGQFEMGGGRPVQGIPSDLRFSFKNIAFAIPSNPDNDALKQIAELGYDKVDASFGLSLAWNEAGQELVLRELSLDGLGMGSAVLRATLGNLPKDIFDPDSAVASIAFLGGTARSAEVTIDNRGLFERFVDREARRQRRGAEDIRREYGMAAMAGIPAVLGNSPAAKTLAQTVARFVAKPGRLSIKARAKSPSGYGVADFTASPDPTSVLNALEITASAE